MQRIIYLISLAFALALATREARADSLTFTVLPSTVNGPAGSTVGWGYSITNTSSTDYLDLTGIDSTLFLATDGTPDASIFNFPNLAPGQTVTQAYDPINSLGLFQFTWNAGLTTGTTEAGIFTLYGAFCAPTDTICADDLSVPSIALGSAPYSATVSPSVVVGTPEPSVLLLLAFGVLALIWLGTLDPKFRSFGFLPRTES